MDKQEKKQSNGHENNTSLAEVISTKLKVYIFVSSNNRREFENTYTENAFFPISESGHAVTNSMYIHLRARIVSLTLIRESTAYSVGLSLQCRSNHIVLLASTPINSSS